MRYPPDLSDYALEYERIRSRLCLSLCGTGLQIINRNDSLPKDKFIMLLVIY